jgi:putative ABC transport system substrate-binding protein
MAQAAAASLRLKIHVVHTVAERDLNAAFDDFRRAQATAVLVFPDAMFIDARGRLAELAAHHRLPVLYPDRTYRILRGEKPADLPVIQSSKFELVINLKTAKGLGLDVPPMLIALADEVIE